MMLVTTTTTLFTHLKFTCINKNQITMERGIDLTKLKVGYITKVGK